MKTTPTMRIWEIKKQKSMAKKEKRFVQRSCSDLSLFEDKWKDFQNILGIILPLDKKMH